MSIAAEVDDIEPLWRDFRAGDAKACERLLALYYDEFRSVARRVLGQERASTGVQPTDLAHDAAIRLLRLDRIEVRDRTHFLALSARVMRQTLIDEVRRHRAQKRSAPPVTTRWLSARPGAPPAIDLEALDDALRRLELVDADLAGLVEQRFFAGLTIEDIAQERGQSTRTVKRRWQLARAWLISDLELD